MEWAEGALVGILVGVSGGMWLLFNLTWIRTSLDRHDKGMAPRLGVLLTLPAFLGGSTWATSTIFAGVFKAEVTVAYLIGATLIIFAINAWPCVQLIRRSARDMGS